MTGTTVNRVWPIGRLRPADHLLPLLPGTLVVAFGLAAGGYFPQATALGVIALIVAFVCISR